MKRYIARIGILFVLACLISTPAAAASQGKKRAIQRPPESGDDGAAAVKFIRPSGLIPSFPEAAACQSVASPFGSSTRYDGSARPDDRYGGLHGGMDLSLNTGTPLRAIAAGTIIHAGIGGQAEGTYLWLQLAPKDTGLPFWVYAKYQHLADLPKHAVSTIVQAGQIVGLSGKTGTTGGHYGSAGYPHLHLTAFAGPSERYEIEGSRVRAEGSRIIDPVAIYVPNLASIDEIGHLRDDRKTVPIPFATDDGSIHPAGSRLVWPVGCKPR